MISLAAARMLDTAEKRWPHTLIAVEGDSFAAWEYFQKHRPTWSWDQCHGWGITIGTVLIGKTRLKQERMPVCVSVTWDIVNGELVAFFEATSQVVDHRMVDKYIRESCPRRTNLMNLHHATQAIEEAAALRLSTEQEKGR